MAIDPPARAAIESRRPCGAPGRRRCARCPPLPAAARAPRGGRSGRVDRGPSAPSRSRSGSRPSSAGGRRRTSAPSDGAPGGTRTHDLQVRNLTLYPLSYGRTPQESTAPSRAGPATGWARDGLGPRPASGPATTPAPTAYPPGGYEVDVWRLSASRRGPVAIRRADTSGAHGRDQQGRVRCRRRAGSCHTSYPCGAYPGRSSAPGPRLPDAGERTHHRATGAGLSDGAPAEDRACPSEPARHGSRGSRAPTRSRD